MYKLVKTPNLHNPYDHVSVEVSSSSAESLGDLLELYEDFLKACGFSLQGHLDVVPSEYTEEQKADFNDFLDSRKCSECPLNVEGLSNEKPE